MKERKENLPPVKKEVSMKIVFPSGMKRCYFNRFSISRADGVQIVNVFYQDDFLRTSNAYSFIVDDEDLATFSASIKTYIQRVMSESSLPVDSGFKTDRTADVQEIDPVRFVRCSRSGNRAEIYLGFVPLLNIISPDIPPDDLKMEMGVTLCSRLGCHIDLLRELVDGK